MKVNGYTIIRDSREKDGWNWSHEEKKSGYHQILGTKVLGLESADYSIEIDGKVYSDYVVIERKTGWNELVGNYSPAANKERFEREMERMRDIPNKYILIESQVSQDILGFGPVQMKFPIPGSRLYQWLLELQQEYGVNVQFVGDAGKRVARLIFENAIKRL